MINLWVELPSLARIVAGVTIGILALVALGSLV